MIEISPIAAIVLIIIIAAIFIVSVRSELKWSIKKGAKKWKNQFLLHL